MIKHHKIDAKSSSLSLQKVIKMRTTLDIDNDILQVAKEIAKRDGISMGKALSRLARQGLIRSDNVKKRNGVPLFPQPEKGTVVTLELVNQLRDEIE